MTDVGSHINFLAWNIPRLRHPFLVDAFCAGPGPMFVLQAFVNRTAGAVLSSSHFAHPNPLSTSTPPRSRYRDFLFVHLLIADLQYNLCLLSELACESFPNPDRCLIPSGRCESELRLYCRLLQKEFALIPHHKTP